MFRSSVQTISHVTPKKTAKAAVKKVFVSSNAPKGYDPTQHKWQMALDVNKCIGCGFCAEACKKENNVPEVPHYFRTWIERYIIKKPKPGSAVTRGEVIVDSPNGGIGGFPPTLDAISKATVTTCASILNFPIFEAEITTPSTAAIERNPVTANSLPIMITTAHAGAS